METEVILEIKPIYINYIRFLYNVVLTFLVILFLAVFDWLIPVFIGLPEPQIWYFYIVMNILLLLFSTGVIMFFDKKNYEVTSYKVYKDRIEFEEGFINHKYTTIRMVDIKEIHLDQSFIQRQAKLGTIRFITAANNTTTSTGVSFRDIQNSMAVYTKIKQIQENSQQAYRA